MCIQEIVADSPKWTDIVGALSSAIGVPLVIWTLIKLMKKDKERESEINSLSTMAVQLTDMLATTEKRYKASKKPQIDIKLEYLENENKLKFYFLNKNLNSTIIEYELLHHTKDFMTSSINEVNGQQSFVITINGKENKIESFVFDIDYSTEEGYVFGQQVILIEKNVGYGISPTVVMDKENLTQ